MVRKVTFIAVFVLADDGCLSTPLELLVFVYLLQNINRTHGIFPDMFWLVDTAAVYSVAREWEKTFWAFFCVCSWKTSHPFHGGMCWPSFIITIIKCGIIRRKPTHRKSRMVFSCCRSVRGWGEFKLWEANENLCWFIRLWTLLPWKFSILILHEN